MATPDVLLDRLQAQEFDFADGLDRETIDRILTEPEMNSLAEALAADAIDAFPVVGDAVSLMRLKRAEEQDIEYPARPAAVENVVSDFPPPIDTIGDVLISQNVLHYLEENTETPLTDLPADIEEGLAADWDNLVDRLTSA